MRQLRTRARLGRLGRSLRRRVMPAALARLVPRFAGEGAALVRRRGWRNLALGLPPARSSEPALGAAEQALAGKTLVLVVGAQKGGTSWLHDYFLAHDEMTCSPIKELHYFDARFQPDLFGVMNVQFLRRLQRVSSQGEAALDGEMLFHLIDRIRMIRNPDVYFEYFAKLNRERGRNLLCEVTPSYSMISEPGLHEVLRMVTQAGLSVKVIFMMRDPIDRHYSQLRMKEAGSLRKENARAKKKAQPVDANRDFLHYLGDDVLVTKRGRYDKIVPKLIRVFGQENVKVSFYENVFFGDERYIRDITDFLGIGYRRPDMQKRINSSPPGEQLSRAQIDSALAVYRPVYNYVDQAFRDEKPASWLF